MAVVHISEDEMRFFWPFLFCLLEYQMIPLNLMASGMQFIAAETCYAHCLMAKYISYSLSVPKSGKVKPGTLIQFTCSGTGVLATVLDSHKVTQRHSLAYYLLASGVALDHNEDVCKQRSSRSGCQQRYLTLFTYTSPPSTSSTLYNSLNLRKQMPRSLRYC